MHNIIADLEAAQEGGALLGAAVALALALGYRAALAPAENLRIGVERGVQVGRAPAFVERAMHRDDRRPTNWANETTRDWMRSIGRWSVVDGRGRSGASSTSSCTRAACGVTATTCSPSRSRPTISSTRRLSCPPNRSGGAKSVLGRAKGVGGWGLGIGAESPNPQPPAPSPQVEVVVAQIDQRRRVGLRDQAAPQQVGAREAGGSSPDSVCSLRRSSAW